MKILTIQNKREYEYKIHIKGDIYTIINKSESITILGFVQNRRNTMDTHLNSLAAKVGMMLANLKPALTFMSEKVRKRIITANVKSLALYGLQLILGQPQSIIQRVCAILMCINRQMFQNIEG